MELTVNVYITCIKSTLLFESVKDVDIEHVQGVRIRKRTATSFPGEIEARARTLKAAFWILAKFWFKFCQCLWNKQILDRHLTRAPISTRQSIDIINVFVQEWSI
jgi:hypothetical protein